MIKLFLDLDGTLAKFNNRKNALQKFDKEIGFFANLKPYKYIDIINNINNEYDNIQIYIISATPNEQADKDKIIWINKYLYSIAKTNICFCRLGENKAQVIKDKLNITIDNSCILLDDYTKNLVEWENLNGIGIKRLTSKADNSRKLWNGYTLKYLYELELLLTNIINENNII